MLYLGGSAKRFKEVGFKGSIPKVEELRKELKRIGTAIVKHYPALHQSVLAAAHDTDECASNNPLSRTLSLIMGDIENKCLMAAIACIETLGLNAAVLVFDGFMVHDPEEQISAEFMSQWVFEDTGYRIQWDRKELDATLKDLQPLSDEIVAGIVMKPLKGRILICNNLMFAFHAPSGLWKKYKEVPLVIEAAIDDWGMDRKIFHGFSV